MFRTIRPDTPYAIAPFVEVLANGDAGLYNNGSSSNGSRTDLTQLGFRLTRTVIGSEGRAPASPKHGGFQYCHEVRDLITQVQNFVASVPYKASGQGIRSSMALRTVQLEPEELPMYGPRDEEDYFQRNAVARAIFKAIHGEETFANWINDVPSLTRLPHQSIS